MKIFIYITLILFSHNSIASLLDYKNVEVKYNIYYKGMDAGDMIFKFEKKENNEIEASYVVEGSLLAKISGRSGEIQKATMKYKENEIIPIKYTYKKLGNKEREISYIYKKTNLGYKVIVNDDDKVYEIKSDKKLYDPISINILFIINSGFLKDSYNVVSKGKYRENSYTVNKNISVNINNKDHKGYSVEYNTDRRNYFSVFGTELENILLYKIIKKKGKTRIKIIFSEIVKIEK